MINCFVDVANTVSIGPGSNVTGNCTTLHIQFTLVSLTSFLRFEGVDRMFNVSEVWVSGLKGVASVPCVMISGTYYASGAVTGVVLGVVLTAADVIGNLLPTCDLNMELTAEGLLSAPLDTRLRHELRSSTTLQHPATVLRHANSSRSVSVGQAEFDRQLRQQQLVNDTALAAIRAQHAVRFQHAMRFQQTIAAARTQGVHVGQADWHLQLDEQRRLHEQALTGNSADLHRRARQELARTSAQHMFELQSLRDEHDRQLKQIQAHMKICRLRSACGRDMYDHQLQADQVRSQPDAQVLSCLIKTPAISDVSYVDFCTTNLPTTKTVACVATVMITAALQTCMHACFTVICFIVQQNEAVLAGAKTWTD